MDGSATSAFCSSGMRPLTSDASGTGAWSKHVPPPEACPEEACSSALRTTSYVGPSVMIRPARSAKST